MSGVKCSGTELSLAHCRQDEDVACPQGAVQYGAGVACSESESPWGSHAPSPTQTPQHLPADSGKRSRREGLGSLGALGSNGRAAGDQGAFVSSVPENSQLLQLTRKTAPSSGPLLRPGKQMKHKPGAPCVLASFFSTRSKKHCLFSHLGDNLASWGVPGNPRETENRRGTPAGVQNGPAPEGSLLC